MFGAEGALKSLKLAPFRMGASDDLKLDVEGGPPVKVSLRGASLDARSVVKGHHRAGIRRPIRRISTST